MANVREQLYKMKMAGGDILSFNDIELFFINSDRETEVKAFLRKLMPGYVLIERRDLMTALMSEKKDGLETLFDYIKVIYSSSIDDAGNRKWRAWKKEAGWIVPIAVGFKGISEVCKAKNQRDQNTEHRFAESVVTLGEFKMPYRFQQIDDIMWSYSVDSAQGMYVCKNQQ
ncbi:CRISPR-associated protein Csy2 [Sporomusaceae bacterium FL31]|nr:CRISPR-associated protein Csy2 [Sporomusaceae bacterium]